jgi:hypothetical protein
VRAKLREICPQNVFSATTLKWKRDIIDEIEEAIASGWCDCCEWGGMHVFEMGGGTLDLAIHRYYDSQGHEYGCIVTATALWSPLAGVAIGPPGFRGRVAVMDISTSHDFYYTFYPAGRRTYNNHSKYYYTLTDSGLLYYLPGLPNVLNPADLRSPLTSSTGCDEAVTVLNSSNAFITVGGRDELVAAGILPLYLSYGYQYASPQCL